MPTEIPDILPNRLNFDAIVFCGCTMKEMQIIAVISLAFCLLSLGILTECLFHLCLIGVGLGFPTGVGMSWVVAHILQRAKQGKPKGYMKQKLLLWCEDKKLFPEIYIRRSGKWSIGKYLLHRKYL